MTIGTPDDVISQEIHDRGIVSPPTRAELNRLAARGAGAHTLAALRALAKGTLTVVSRPGECEVVIDGRPAGVTRADGRLIVSDVNAGEHTVRVQKEGFQPADFPVIVDVGGQASIAAALESARGSLTVLANVPDSTIRINGLGTYQGAARDIRCPAGSYTIDVRASRYNPVRRTVAVAAGQVSEIRIDLAPDPAVLDGLRQEIRSRVNGRNPLTAIESSEQLLQLVPTDPEANAGLAAGQYAAGNVAAFRAAADKALSVGGTVTVHVIHHHAFMSQHEALLGLSSAALVFDPLGAPCSFRAGRIPASRITRVQAVKERVRRAGGLNLEYFLEVNFRPEGRDDKTASMKFTNSNNREAGMLEALVELISRISRQPESQKPAAGNP